MLSVLLSGGWVVWPILLCSLIVVAIGIERLWVLRLKVVAPPGLLGQFRDPAAFERLDASQRQQLASSSMLGELLVGLFERRGRNGKNLREYLETAGRAAGYRLGNHISLVGTIAALAPLLGVLGTVLGMIKVFGALMAGGIGDVNTLAGGIGEALITTALGISVAVPTHLLHTELTRRAERMALALERDSIEFLSWIDGGVSSPEDQPAE